MKTPLNCVHPVLIAALGQPTGLCGHWTASHKVGLGAAKAPGSGIPPPLQLHHPQAGRGGHRRRGRGFPLSRQSRGAQPQQLQVAIATTQAAGDSPCVMQLGPLPNPPQPQCQSSQYQEPPTGPTHPGARPEGGGSSLSCSPLAEVQSLATYPYLQARAPPDPAGPTRASLSHGKPTHPASILDGVLAYCAVSVAS